MRIATWNLARSKASGSRAAALQKYIAAVDADVWVLTETQSEFTPGASFALIAASVEASDLSPGERWSTVWVRSGIYGEPVASGDAERTACARLRLPSGRQLYVYGTVLPWLSDGRRDPIRGAAAFQLALAEQAADWKRIRREAPDVGLCVAGDLNQDLLPVGHFYGSAAGRTALRDVLITTGLVCLTGGDRDPVAGLGGGRASIDHVCLTDSVLASLSAQPCSQIWPEPTQLGPTLTDHFGIAVELQGL
jgi:hypothetical protein